jgi:RND superfamily putative drug exporter
VIFRRRRAIAIGALVLVAVAAVFALPVFGELGNDNDFDDPHAEAVAARTAVNRTTGALSTPSIIALVRLGAPIESRPARERIARVAAVLRDPGVASVVAYDGSDRRLVSRDGRSTYLLATFKNDDLGARTRIEQRLGDVPWVVLGGGAIAAPAVGDQVGRDIARAELIAFPILFALTLLVFRSAVSALLPLAVGGATILLSFLAIRIVNANVNPMSIYALNLINGLGLGLAIDYSLFMVSRFREELAGGKDREAALAATLRTAGHVVAFSAVTVACALAALIVFRQRFLYSMGVGGTLCALIAAAVSLTLLPALLGMLGERVNAGGPRRWKEAIAREARAERSGFWYRHSQRVMRRPIPVATGAAVVLIALGLPFAGIKFTGIDASVLPRDQPARIVDDAIKTQFPPSETSPVYIAVPRDADVRSYVSRLPAPVAPPRVRPGRIDLIAPGAPLSDEATAFVRSVRAVRAPFERAVGGQTAGFLDQQRSLRDHLPLAGAILATTTLLILFVMTRSVVLPVKALVMNLLSLCAAFGLLVVVFQDGHLDWLLRFDSQGAIESSQPVLLFAVAFGLSTDYGVFLLGRIKELHDAGLSNEEAVALGLQRTGRIVTFAAALMVVALGCFVTASIIFIKQLGFGVAVAVLIDATIVRALLVPALMRLLGDWNWWVPRPLAKLLPA